MAELGGYKTAASANTAFAVLRRKLIGDYQQWAGRATRGKGKPVLVVEDSEDDDEEAEAGEAGEAADEGEDAVAVPGKKAPLKRKAGTTTEGADAGDAEGEETEAEGPIKKKMKGMKVGGAVEGEKEKENDKVVEAAEDDAEEEAADADDEEEA